MVIKALPNGRERRDSRHIPGFRVQILTHFHQIIILAAVTFIEVPSMTGPGGYMLMFRVRGKEVASLLSQFDTNGWEECRRLGNIPSSPGKLQVLLGEKLFLRNLSTMGLVITVELVVSDEVVVTINTLGGRAGLLRVQLWANEEMEQEAAMRLKVLAKERDWQVTVVEEYHHHD